MFHFTFKFNFLSLFTFLTLMSRALCVYECKGKAFSEGH